MKEDRQVVLLNLEDILPNRFQPRIKFDEKAIVELSESIREHGVIQPIIVRKMGDKYEIIAGERRYKASVMSGKTNIPAIIVDLNDKDSSEIALIENVQRQDLTPIEEAISYRKIFDMGYMTQEELAKKLGVSQSTIANKLRLLNLDDEVQDALLESKISERHARALLRLKSSDQKKMLKKIIDERLTVRKTDEEINNMLNSKEQNVFDSFNKNPIEENFQENNISLTNTANPFVIPNDSTKINENVIQNNNSVSTSNASADVEVLDFGFEDINPENTNDQASVITDDMLPTENNIQQSEMNETDIPVAPIVNDVEPLEQSYQNPIPGPIIDDVSFNNEQINDSVQNFNPENTNMDTNINQVSETEVNEHPRQNKFFNMFQTENDIEENIDNPENNINNNLIDSSSSVENIFGQNFNVVSDSQESNYESNNSQNDMNSFPQFNLNQFNDMNIEQPTLNNNQNEDSVNQTEEVEPPVAQVITPLETETLDIDDEQSEVPSIEEEDTQIPTLRDVINKIRKCADEIEKMNFEIDSEEFDFDDMYQVIFKIKK